MKPSSQLLALGTLFLLCRFAIAIDYSWTGIPNPPNPPLFDGDWSNVTRWDHGTFYPSTSADSASIAPLGDPFFTVVMDEQVHIGAMNFNSPNALLDLTNRVFRVDGANDWLAGTVISHNTQVLDSGAGTLTLGPDATATFDRTTLIDTATVDLQGNLKVEALTNNTQLTITHGATNTGLIEVLTDSTASSKLVLNSGPLTNSGGGSVGELHFNGIGAGVREFQGDLINDGVVRVMNDARFSKFGTTVTNAGAWVIDPDVTLSLNGSGQTFDHNGNDINVLGDFEGLGLTFNFNDGSISNNGLTLTNSTLNIGAEAGDGSFTILGNSGYSGNLKAVHELTVLSTTHATNVTAANGFTNNTQLKIESAGTNLSRLTVTSGALENLAAGTITLTSDSGLTRLNSDLTNAGTVVIEGNAAFEKTNGVVSNNGTFTIASGSNFSNSTQMVWNNDGGVLDVQGEFSPVFMTLNYNDGMITGQPITLTNSNLNLGPNAGSGTFLQRGSSTYSGDIQVNQSVTVLSDTVNTAIVAADGFTNDGELILNSTNTAEAKLTISSGLLTNASTGTLGFEGANGLRTLVGDLTNAGLMQVNGDTALSGIGSSVVNSGQLNIASNAALRMTSGGNQSFSQQGGTLANDGEFVADFVIVNFTGGNIAGNPIVISIGQLHIGASAGTGAFILRRGSVYSGDLLAGQTVTMRGDSHNTVVSAASPFSSSGLLILETLGASSRFDVNGGPLVNNSDGEIRFTGTPGLLELRADINNQGLITIEDDASLGTTAKNIVNSGVFQVDAVGKMIGTSFVNEASGLITGSGGLDVTQSSFTNSGELAPGNGIGSFEITGSMGSTASALLSLEIGSTAEYDQLLVSGNVLLDGNLAVQLVDLGSGLFIPSAIDTFTVLTAGNIVGGALANVANGTRLSTLGGEGSFLVTYDEVTDAVVLSDFATELVGDYNDDGVVNIADYTVWRNNLGGPGGTLPNDTTAGEVGAAQYDLWKANFGNALPAVGTALANVPEPTTAALLALVAGSVLPWRLKLVLFRRTL
ncbi:beta strand repeat-containing protein [Aeoliella sp.]|uniref:beta strand repeat-containing protein n=1 Tax=Aeoliella sp. TaxID=2795800 RepID=UPI003CCC309C